MPVLLQITDSTTKSINIVETIKAISGTWPLVLIIIVTIFVIVYRRSLGKFIQRFNKVSGKTGPVEVNFEQTNIQEPPSNPGIIQGSNTNSNLKETMLEKGTEEVKKPTFFNIYKELKNGNLNKADEIFEEIQTKVTNSDEREKNNYSYLYFKFQYAGINTIEELEDLISKSKNKTNRITGLLFLGDCLVKAKQYSKAEENLRSAYMLCISDDEDRAVDIVLEIANCFSEASKPEDAIAYLKDIKKNFIKDKNIAKLYWKLASFFDSDSNWLERCLAIELAVKHDPTSKEYLFEAGYSYSNLYRETENKILPLSLLHYKELVSFSDNAAGYNNLGVAYSELQMPNKAVKNYKKAIDLKNTLAASNLAYKYIYQGFFEEAKTLLEQAKNETNVDKNVWQALKRIEDDVKEESNKESEVMQLAKATQAFIRKFGTEYFNDQRNSSIGISGKWKVNDFEVSIKQLSNPIYYEITWKDDKFKYSFTLDLNKNRAVISSGNYEKKEGGLIGKIVVFSILRENQIDVLFYNKQDSKSFFFTIISETSEL
ncbi:MAG: hypothetical protein M9904_06345 [Chitinophagaceae bacterium]|nr:hypothetical protein [Chitinophagaceae bacterium]